MNILITDGENRSSLAVTRSLGRKGFNVFVSGTEHGNISASSKYCRKAFIAPDPMKQGNNYLLKIAEIIAKEKIDIIFPMTEQSIYRLNEGRKLLEKQVVLACAPSDKMQAVSDKYRLFQLAEKSCVPIPRTIYVDGALDLLDKMDIIQKYPVVIKPICSKIMDGDKILSTSVMYADDEGELKRLFETNAALQYPSLIQEKIIGEGTGLFTLFDGDRHLALFSHRRILEKPPSGGVSVLSESIPLDTDMVDSARKLLSEVGWQGVAMVEFKRDVRDGQPKLMEINGRFWGSLQLAVSSGIDFPNLCLDYYNGRKPSSLLSNYRIGHRLKWFYGILDHLIVRLRNKNISSKLSPETASLWGVFKHLLPSGKLNISSDVYDRNDFGPFMAETKNYITNAFRKLK